MAVQPSSVINLCNVPFDKTYKNVIYCADRAQQAAYFEDRIVLPLEDYLPVRSTRSDGSLISSVRVGIDIDTLQNKGVNYMFYQNLNIGNKTYYAFIDKLVYVNPDTTEIIFEQDVYQTWLFDVEILPSFVVREHSETDKIGDNIVPENFNYNDYIYSKISSVDELEEIGYLVGSTEMFGTNGERGKHYSGIYQGLYLYYYENDASLNTFLTHIEEEDQDCVVFVTCCPKFCMNESYLGEGTTPDGSAVVKGEGEGYVSYSDKPAQMEIKLDMSSKAFSFDGYTPKNKKLYTNPFYSLTVTNNQGAENSYSFEDFTDRNNIYFKMYGDVSSTPSIMLVPCFHKRLNFNYDEAIPIANYPQCAYNNDTFKLWWSKNKVGVVLNTISSMGMIFAGASGSNAQTAAAGATQLAETINSVYQAYKEPNKYNPGTNSNNLLLSMKICKYIFYCKRIKADYAETIDNYFTMYGYATNKLKLPNLDKRPYWNYVETRNINIKGSIPNEDLNKIKNIYDSGVTLWKYNAVFCDYSKDNSPAEA